MPTAPLLTRPVPGASGEDSFEVEINGSPREITIYNNLAYEGQIEGGVNSSDDIEVLLTGDGVLETASPDASGRFRFYGLADGDYVVKVRKRATRRRLPGRSA